MRTTSRHAALAVVVAALGSSALVAQEPVREFCRDEDFPELCPGEDCPCVDDTLEIVFERQLDSSIYEYDVFDPSEIIRSRVLLDTVSDQVRGYSVGVAFDTDDINPLPGPRGLNDDGGPQGEDPPRGFRCQEICHRLVVEGGERKGFVVAIVFSFGDPVVLPVARNVVFNANYRLERDVGPKGTLLRFSDELGNPPTQVALVLDQLEFPEMVDRDERNCVDQIDNDFDGLVDRDDPDCVVRTGVARRPRTVIDGLIRRRVERAPFQRGDTDGDGTVDLIDAVRLSEIVVGTTPPAFDCDPLLDANDDGQVDLSDAVTIVEHAVRGGPALPRPFGQCGEDGTFDQLVCLESNCP